MVTKTTTLPGATGLSNSTQREKLVSNAPGVFGNISSSPAPIARRIFGPSNAPPPIPEQEGPDMVLSVIVYKYGSP